MIGAAMVRYALLDRPATRKKPQPTAFGPISHALQVQRSGHSSEVAHIPFAAGHHLGPVDIRDSPSV